MRQSYSIYFYTIIIFCLPFITAFNADIDAGSTRTVAESEPCKLLTPKQVETVLPGHDGGYTALSGGSLFDGVDSYQCSYTNGQSGVLLVVLHIAADKGKLEWIKSHSVSLDTEINIGDGGWISSDSTEIKLVATKGLKVLKLNLISSEANKKTDMLIKLASGLLENL